MQVANEMKLQVEGKKRGWTVEVWAVEVGCRSFPASSMAKFLKDIGISGKKKRGSLRKVGKQQ